MEAGMGGEGGQTDCQSEGQLYMETYEELPPPNKKRKIEGRKQLTSDIVRQLRIS